MLTPKLLNVIKKPSETLFFIAYNLLTEGKGVWHTNLPGRKLDFYLYYLKRLSY